MSNIFNVSPARILPANAYWDTRVFDFENMANQNISNGGDGAKTIGGVSWTLGNSAAADSIQIVNGSGLVFDFNATNSTAVGQGQNAPWLDIGVEVMFGMQANALLAYQPIVIKAYLADSGDAAEEVFGVGIWDRNTTGGNTYGFSALKGFSGAAAGIKVYRYAVATFTAASVATTDNEIALVYTNHDCTMYRGVYSTASGFKPITSLTQFSYSSINVTPTTGSTVMRPANLKILITGQTGNTSNNFSGTLKRLEVSIGRALPDV